MKRKQVSTIFILLVAGCLMAGCEKTTGCENYSPWPSSDAIAAWKEYSPNLVDSLDAYNDVATTGSYLGFYPSAYDSTVSMHSRDSILLCGYLSQSPLADMFYYLTDSIPLKPFNRDREKYILVAVIDTATNNYVDTTKRAYIRGEMRGNEMREKAFCNSYYYITITDLNRTPIKYED